MEYLLSGSTVAELIPKSPVSTEARRKNWALRSVAAFHVRKYRREAIQNQAVTLLPQCAGPELTIRCRAKSTSSLYQPTRYRDGFCENRYLGLQWGQERRLYVDIAVSPFLMPPAAACVDSGVTDRRVNGLVSWLVPANRPLDYFSIRLLQATMVSHDPRWIFL